MLTQNEDHANLHRFQSGEKEVLVIGTAHVSKASSDQVAAVIESEKPDTVCVELCDSRYQAIRQKDRWQNTDIVKVIKEKKAFLLLSNLILAAFQKRIAEKLDVTPGQEMLTAIETAESHGAEILLADRDIRVTLSRTWRALGIWGKMKLFSQLILSLGEVDDISAADIERMKEKDALEAILAEVGKELPELRKILIDERDQYLAEKIRTAPGRKVVAVVGAGHVPGIQKHWKADIDLAALEVLPPRRRWSGILKWIFPLLVLAIFAGGFWGGGTRAGTHMITWWILANGVLAGIGATIALAHPFTIISSMIAAPLTSLNPMVAAGWVSGLVEAFSRKPKVRDFEQLSEDLRSVRGFWKNKITKILLVVVFTNLGSSIGTMVAIPLMLKAMG